MFFYFLGIFLLSGECFSVCNYHIETTCNFARTDNTRYINTLSTSADYNIKCF